MKTVFIDPNDKCTTIDQMKFCVEKNLRTVAFRPFYSDCNPDSNIKCLDTVQELYEVQGYPKSNYSTLVGTPRKPFRLIPDFQTIFKIDFKYITCTQIWPSSTMLKSFQEYLSSLFGNRIDFPLEITCAEPNVIDFSGPIETWKQLIDYLLYKRYKVIKLGPVYLTKGIVYVLDNRPVACLVHHGTLPDNFSFMPRPSCGLIGSSESGQLGSLGPSKTPNGIYSFGDAQWLNCQELTVPLKNLPNLPAWVVLSGLESPVIDQVYKTVAKKEKRLFQ